MGEAVHNAVGAKLPYNTGHMTLVRIENLNNKKGLHNNLHRPLHGCANHTDTLESFGIGPTDASTPF
jgi:hypothetical protein